MEEWRFDQGVLIRNARKVSECVYSGLIHRGGAHGLKVMRMDAHGFLHLVTLQSFSSQR
jgi:hypothetical protein